MNDYLFAGCIISWCQHLDKTKRSDAMLCPINTIYMLTWHAIVYCRCFDCNIIAIPVEIETPDHHYYHVCATLPLFFEPKYSRGGPHCKVLLK